MKMLRSLAASILIIMLFSSTALAASTESVEKAGGKATDVEIKVTKTYEYVSEYGYKYFIAVCENTSDYDLDVSWDTASYDKNGSILETGSSYTAYVSSHQEFALYALFLASKEAADYDYTIHWEEADYILPACRDVDLSCEESDDGQLVITGTNNGTEDLSTIQAVTLFFNEKNEIVGFEDSFLVNQSYNVLAGETVTQSVDVPEAASRYETYYTAYRW
ncbi:hypothetical protein [Butyrivibrio sp. AE3004]|uniref:hypothetical protein n=1 Tax=Butyrivibrio sp. AE3004 TaxID=1506994 RepID=UPI000494748F|nr:hypothetical protein [Butyrivibrio sp. AE3004]